MKKILSLLIALLVLLPAVTFGAVTVVSQGGTATTSFGTGGFLYSPGGTQYLRAIASSTFDILTFGDGLTRTANDVDCDTASGSVFGCLSSADWTTFNNKQAAGNYITALTGDVTASGPGSVAATLATVNSNVGTFGSATQAPQVTVNGKGLVTAASNVTVTPAVGSITGLGTGVGTALGVNVGTAGAFVVNGGALGTPSSGTATNITGLPIVGGTTGTLSIARGGTNATSFTNSTLVSFDGTSLVSTTSPTVSRLDTTSDLFLKQYILGVDAFLTVSGSTGQVGVVPGGDCTGIGFFYKMIPSSTGCRLVDIASSSQITGTLPVANGGTGITSLGSGVATWLGTPSSANLATAVTGETGSGALVFGTSPAFTTGLSTPAITTASGDLTVTPAAGSDLSVNLSTTGDFVVNTDDFFVDTSAGRIGVGTTLPTQVFDIETNENANSIFLLKNASSTGTASAGVIRVSADTALTQVIAHGTGRTVSRYGITLGGYSEIAPSAGNGLIIGTINATPLIFGTSGTVNTTEAMRITTGNFIGIGTTTPAWLVSIQSGSDTNILALKDSDGQCLHNPESASETVTCSSDIKLKKNIADYDKALDYLNVYKVRKYTAKASGDVLVGAIAQEVQKVHPETVRDMKDGTLGVDVPSAWILVAGIQELSALHEQDVARITELENRVKALDGKEATPPVPVESKIPWASVATVVGGLGAGFVGSKIGKKK